jgi:MFS family permease
MFRRNLALLTLCWALIAITNILNVSAAALAGYMLAEDKALATLPLALQWAGVVACTVPASFLMNVVGRRNGFLLAGAISIAGAALAMLALYRANFVLYCAGSVLLGIGQGFAWYYRYAAAESAPAEWKSRAISLVFAGGILSGLVGPLLAEHVKDLLAPITFAGAFAAIVVLQMIALVLLCFIDIPKPPRMRFRGGRPLGQIARQPKFIVAAMAGVVAYAGMVMLMSVTPLAMGLCGLNFEQATSVIQWHVFGMYVPAFFTGHLVKRFGTHPVMLAGGIAMAACTLVGVAGQTYAHFWLAQTLLGVAWNFLYVGATTLLTETYTIEERAKTQALNEFLVFSVTGLAMYFSGQLLHGIGWTAVNLAAMPLVLLTIAGTVWAWVGRRKLTVAAVSP